MKKVVRTVYIGALSGLAFLAACCSQNGLTRKERKQLVKERDSIQEIIKKREMAAVYGSPEIIQNYGLETMRLRTHLDTINYRLGEDVDLEKSAQQLKEKEMKVEKAMKISELRQRLETLQNTIRERESACVYGSPEIIEEYGRETNRLRQQAQELENELEELGQ